MFRTRVVTAALLLASPLSQAQQHSCEGIRAQIDAKIRASGVANFTLQVVEADARLPGKVVGTCDLGSRKIVYNAGTGPAPARTQPKASAPQERILTECKDGSVTYGDCKM